MVAVRIEVSLSSTHVSKNYTQALATDHIRDKEIDPRFVSQG